MGVSERDQNGLCLLRSVRKMGKPSREVRFKELFSRFLREQIGGYFTSDCHLLEKGTLLCAADVQAWFKR